MSTEKLSKLESQLQSKLNDIVNSIRNFIKTRNPALLLTSDNISMYYDSEVMALIRSYAQKAYLLGASNVADRLDNEAYLSDSDLLIIKDITGNQAQRFWGRIQIGLLDQLIESPLGDKKRSSEEMYSNNYITQSIASGVIYKGYNQGLATKAAKLT